MGSKKRIVLVFEFDEVDEGDYVDLDLRKIKMDKERTTLTGDERDLVTEHWGQSDTWHVDIHNDILNVIDSGQSVSYS